MRTSKVRPDEVILERQLREDLCEIGLRMYEQGFSPACGGNISARLAPDCFLITPSAVCKKDLTPDLIVKIDGRGESLEKGKAASSEAKVHLYCYRHRPDVMAVCHAHPPFAVSFACLEEKLDKYFLAEQVYYTGAIPVCPYALPGTDAVAESLEPYIAKHNAFLLANHGPVTLGETVFDAFYRMETVEHYAKITFITKLMGGPREFTEGEKEELFADIDKLGGIHPGNITL